MAADPAVDQPAAEGRYQQAGERPHFQASEGDRAAGDRRDHPLGLADVDGPTRRRIGALTLHLTSGSLVQLLRLVGHYHVVLLVR
jgi:hypothetical protein